MSKDLISRYIWLVDTIRRHGTISRSSLDEKWRNTSFSGGNPLSRRTFYNYRQAIEDIFNITIEYDAKTYDYYIAGQSDASQEDITNWLLNSNAVSDVLSGARDLSRHIIIEDVPSARTYLSTVIEAMRSRRELKIAYQPYSRSTPTTDIRLEPYFLKIFRQRWYVTGLNVRDQRLKTYALDRVTDMSIRDDRPFSLPDNFDPRAYTAGSFGIIFDEGNPRPVSLRVAARRAKYLRALPLHHSQQESVHESYSIFNYNLRLTPDFLQEILSYGPDITVISPPELRAMVVDALSASLKNYETILPPT